MVSWSGLLKTSFISPHIQIVNNKWLSAQRIANPPSTSRPWPSASQPSKSPKSYWARLQPEKISGNMNKQPVTPGFKAFYMQFHFINKSLEALLLIDCNWKLLLGLSGFCRCKWCFYNVTDTTTYDTPSNSAHLKLFLHATCNTRQRFRIRLRYAILFCCSTFRLYILWRMFWSYHHKWQLHLPRSFRKLEILSSRIALQRLVVFLTHFKKRGGSQ